MPLSPSSLLFFFFFFLCVCFSLSVSSILFSSPLLLQHPWNQPLFPFLVLLFPFLFYFILFIGFLFSLASSLHFRFCTSLSVYFRPSAGHPHHRCPLAGIVRPPHRALLFGHHSAKSPLSLGELPLFGHHSAAISAVVQLPLGRCSVTVTVSQRLFGYGHSAAISDAVRSVRDRCGHCSIAATPTILESLPAPAIGWLAPSQSPPPSIGAPPGHHLSV